MVKIVSKKHAPAPRTLHETERPAARPSVSGPYRRNDVAVGWCVCCLRRLRSGTGGHWRHSRASSKNVNYVVVYVTLMCGKVLCLFNKKKCTLDGKAWSPLLVVVCASHAAFAAA